MTTPTDTGRVYGSGPGMIRDARRLRPGDTVLLARSGDDPTPVTVTANHGAGANGFVTVAVDGHPDGWPTIDL